VVHVPHAVAEKEEKLIKNVLDYIEKKVKSKEKEEKREDNLSYINNIVKNSV